MDVGVVNVYKHVHKTILKDEQIKWNGGVLSGWRITSLITSLVNLYYLYDSGLCKEKLLVQGDDTLVGTDDKLLILHSISHIRDIGLKLKYT